MLALTWYPVLALSRSTPPTSSALGKEERIAFASPPPGGARSRGSHADLDSVPVGPGGGSELRGHPELQWIRRCGASDEAPPSSPNLAALLRYAYRPQVGEMYAGAGEICMVCCY